MAISLLLVLLPRYKPNSCLPDLFTRITSFIFVFCGVPVDCSIVIISYFSFSEIYSLSHDIQRRDWDYWSYFDKARWGLPWRSCFEC